MPFEPNIILLLSIAGGLGEPACTPCVSGTTQTASGVRTANLSAMIVPVIKLRPQAVLCDSLALGISVWVAASFCLLLANHDSYRPSNAAGDEERIN